MVVSTGVTIVVTCGAVVEISTVVGDVVACVAVVGAPTPSRVAVEWYTLCTLVTH